MKKILSAVLISLTIMAQAQKPYSISTSSEIELQNKSYADNIISYGTDGVCMVTSKNKGIGGIVAPDVKDTKYSFYAGTTFNKTVDLIEKGDGAKYIESYNNNGKLCYIDALYNKSKNEIETYYREVDNNGNVTKSTLMNNATGGEVFLRAPEYIFKTLQSPNNKKLVNVAIYKNKEKETEYQLCFDGITSMFFKPNSMKIGVIDEMGNLLFKKEISINAPEECDKISLEDYEVNDKGDVFLLVKQYIKGKKEKKDEEANYKIYIYAITNNGTSSKKYIIDTKEYFVSKPALASSNNGNIYCAGFLSEKVTGKFTGVFTQKLGADLDVSQYKISNINSEDIVKYNSKFKYKNDEISNGFGIDYILEKADGISIIAEYFRMTYYRSTNGQVTYTYRYGDILVFDLDNSLNLSNIYAIPKYQIVSVGNPYSQITKFLSYRLVLHNNNPYFIFNDNKNNVDKDEEDKIKNAPAKLSNLAPVIVYHNGTSWVRERMFEKDDVDDNFLMTRAVRQFDENNIFLPFQKKGNYVLGKLTFTK